MNDHGNETDSLHAERGRHEDDDDGGADSKKIPLGSLMRGPLGREGAADVPTSEGGEGGADEKAARRRRDP